MLIFADLADKKRIEKNASIFDQSAESIDEVNFNPFFYPLHPRKSAFYSLTLSTTRFSSGVYMLILNGERGVVSWKMVK